MNLSKDRFFKAKAAYRRSDGSVGTRDIWSYETKDALYDVSSNEAAVGDMYFRKNMGAWSKNSEPIHEEIMKHFKLRQIEHNPPLDKKFKKIVREYLAEEKIKIPDRIQRLINMLTMDLYHGPYEAGALDEDGLKWPGWGKASDEVCKWLNKQDISDFWYDDFAGYVMLKEPEAWKDEESGEWIEPEWEEIYKIESSDVLKTILGNELYKDIGC